MRQARGVALGEGAPHASTRQLGRYALADERPRLPQRHNLGHAARPVAGEHAFHTIGVVKNPWHA